MVRSLIGMIENQSAMIETVQRSEPGLELTHYEQHVATCQHQSAKYYSAFRESKRPDKRRSIENVRLNRSSAFRVYERMSCVDDLHVVV